MECMRRLNSVYRSHEVLYSDSRNPITFEWVNRNDADRNIFAYIRRNPWNYNSAVLVVCNFSPVRYDGYTCGVPVGGALKRVFSTYDSLPDGGGPARPEDGPELVSWLGECDRYPYHLSYDLRPFEAMIIELPTSIVKEAKQRSSKKRKKTE